MGKVRGLKKLYLVKNRTEVVGLLWGRIINALEDEAKKKP